jgi:class 3 adenylate cyclase/tetratricopeptide (TPR) repeat protein
MTTLCSTCGFDNPPGMRFCGQCGTRLSEAPPATVSTSAAGPAFQPEHLGVMMGADLLERFRHAGLEAAGQRRNVTVLFADIAGYTPLSEQLDNEDLYNLIQQYIAILVNDVYKYEGTVDKFTGDGLMALFGAPIAHENNAELAVRAGLDMQADVQRLSQELEARLGVNIRIRIGLHSGSVIVGSMGSDMLMNYTAIGNTVNLASRLQTAADSGTLLVSETVHQQTKALFEYRAVPPLVLKGVAHPVPGFQALGAKLKPGSVRGVEGLRARMVGRDAELQQLRQVAQALSSRRLGHLVLVTGEAGIGKSRLVREFKALLDPAAVRILEGHSLTYRRGVTYWVFQEVLRHYLEISADLPEAEVRAKLIKRAYETLSVAAADLLPYLEHLLSLAPSDAAAAERISLLDASQLRQQIFLAVRDLLVAEAQRRPLVLVLEDLHWADEASLDLILFLLDSVRQAPLLIYAISRPFQVGPLRKVTERAQRLLGERFVSLQLQNLSLDLSEQLLLQLLTIPELPASLREQILQRAAGNPFYLEEILRMLIDAEIIRQEGIHWRLVPGVDITQLGVPETLQALILARFDRLGELPRRVLQVASVIGRYFSLALLFRVLQPLTEREVREVLTTLVEREYLLPAPGMPDADYVFRHVLVSDAIYSTLLKRHRSELHGQIGAVMEAMYAGQLDRQAEILARHYSWSLRLDRALHYLLLAGQRAARGYANEQARQHFRQALGLLPKVAHTPDQALQAHMGLGDVLVLTGEYQSGRAYYQQVLELLSTGDPALYAKERGVLERKLGTTFERQGDYDQALLCLASAQSALDDAPAPLPVERAQIFNDIGWTELRRGNLSEAETYLLQALGLVENTAQYDVIASIYNRLGGVYYQKEQLNKASYYVRKSLVLREEIGDQGAVARSYTNLGLLEWKRGDWTSALESFQRSIELTAALGDIEGMASLHSNLGLLQIDRGNFEEAKRHLEEALIVAQQFGIAYHIGIAYLHFSLLYLSLEDWKTALDYGQRSLEIYKEIDSPENIVDAHANIGRAWLGLGNFSEAQAAGAEAVALCEKLGADKASALALSRASALRLLGEVARWRGDYDEADKLLRESAAVFVAAGNQVEQGRANVALALLAAARGDRSGARVVLNEARLIFRQLGARGDLGRVEVMMANLAAR